MTTRHYTDWPPRLPAIARMRKAGQTWKEIGPYFGVSKEAMLGVGCRYAEELASLAAKDVAAKEPEAKNPAALTMASTEPASQIVPELFVENGFVVKRYPPMWAEGTGFGVTAKPRARPKRSD